MLNLFSWASRHLGGAYSGRVNTWALHVARRRRQQEQLVSVNKRHTCSVFPRGDCFHHPLMKWSPVGKGFWSRASVVTRGVEMAKSSSRRSLKSFFSRSEVSLDKSVEKEERDGEKKRFRFLKLKKKTKNDVATVKAANGTQDLVRYVCRTSGICSSDAGSCRDALNGAVLRGQSSLLNTG